MDDSIPSPVLTAARPDASRYVDEWNLIKLKIQQEVDPSLSLSLSVFLFLWLFLSFFALAPQSGVEPDASNEFGWMIRLSLLLAPIDIKAPYI